MGLLQKKPLTGTATPFYSLSTDKTFIIVGLGNPGKKYVNTRHNIGFICADDFALKHEFSPWKSMKELKCLVSIGIIGNARVVAVKPTPYMNLSGEAIQLVKQFYKVNPDQIIAVHDELDVPFGQIRTREAGGSAGHNGIKSLIQHLGEDFGRVRVGIGPKTPQEMESADFVLAKFNKDEEKQIPALTREVSVILNELLFANEFPTETRSFM